MSYYTYEQETIAILEGLLKWEDKFFGYHFVIVTEHKAVEFFRTQGNLSWRQTQWYEYLPRFNYDIHMLKDQAMSLLMSYHECGKILP